MVGAATATPLTGAGCSRMRNARTCIGFVLSFGIRGECAGHEWFTAEHAKHSNKEAGRSSTQPGSCKRHNRSP